MENLIKLGKPSTLLDPYRKQLDEINRQYHDFNKLHLSVDGLGQHIQISYSDEDGNQAPLTNWLDSEQIVIYLQNYQRIFCMDPKRLDLFFKLSEATAIIPISWLRPTRKRRQGICHAYFYMREAYQGLRPQRKPVLVRLNKMNKGQFDIIDGNSSYYIAQQIGITSLPVIMLDKDFY